MQNDFINLKKPKNTGSGVADKVYLALVDWFVEPNGIKSPGVWAAPGDDVIIKLTHEFKPGFGFIELQLAPEKNSYGAKSGGDTGFAKFANEVIAIVPGSYEEQHEMMGNLLNKAVIALVKDSNCRENLTYQVGTSCVYAYVGAGFTTGTTKDGQKAYALSITNNASKVYLYQGDVTAGPDLQPVIARITGDISGTTVSLDATESTISGTVVYEYKVFYNDENDVRQTITLPETGDTAAFDTSILIGWNEAGFAVTLKVTNEIDNDTTITSDASGERPFNAGAFDSGFDDGFDFNL